MSPTRDNFNGVKTFFDPFIKSQLHGIFLLKFPTGIKQTLDVSSDKDISYDSKQNLLYMFVNINRMVGL